MLKMVRGKLKSKSQSLRNNCGPNFNSKLVLFESIFKQLVVTSSHYGETNLYSIYISFFSNNSWIKMEIVGNIIQPDNSVISIFIERLNFST